jgi:hypothetical protein
MGLVHVTFILKEKYAHGHKGLFAGLKKVRRQITPLIVTIQELFMIRKEVLFCLRIELLRSFLHAIHPIEK